MSGILSNKNDEYFEDILLLLSTLSSEYKNLAKWVNENCSSKDDSIDATIVEELDLSAKQLKSILSISIAIAEETDCKKEKLEQILKELIKKKKFKDVITEEKRDQFLKFFELITEGLNEKKKQEQEKSTLVKGVATLHGFAICPISKFHRTEEIKLENEFISKYKPEKNVIQTFLIEVAVRTSLGKEHLAFQATKESISEMKKLLEVAEIEMAALEKNSNQKD